MGVICNKTKFKLDQILKRYYKFTKLQNLNSKKLTKHALQNYKIKFKLETTLKFFLVYKLIKIKNLVLKKFIKKKNLKKGYILRGEVSSTYKYQ